MKRSARLSLVVLFPLLFCSIDSLAQSPSPSKALKAEPAAAISRSVMDINNLWVTVRNDGVIGYESGGRLVTYPMDIGGLVYGDNLVWVGKVKDGRQPELRTGGGLWHSLIGVEPGAVLAKGVAEDPSSSSVRVYRIRPDYRAADLRMDAAGIYQVSAAAVTPEMITAIRQQYEKDWSEWPWQKGAPFVDVNGNGVMDPGERPGLLNADQVLWFAYNDLNEDSCLAFYGGPSIGIEVQVTIWAYRNVWNLEDVVFKRYRLIFKGTSSTPADAAIDSMYLSQWVDADVGNYADDLGGCDSVLSLGFQFSSSNPDAVYKGLGGANPAVGYAILQGPLVPGNADDEAVFDFAPRKGMKNVPMTSFLLNPTGDPISEPSRGHHTFWFWYALRGFFPYDMAHSTRPFVDPDGNVTTFTYAGDPVARTGWIDGLGKFWGDVHAVGYSVVEGERRIMLNTGPFKMALADTQEIVVAIIASAAQTGPENVTWLKNRTKLLRGIYPNLSEYVAESKKEEISEAPPVPYDFALEQNFPNPFNPATQIRYAIPIDANVRLAVYDVMGREIRVLKEEFQAAGGYSITWDGRDAQNELVPSGVYFYRLETGRFQETKKMVIVR